MTRLDFTEADMQVFYELRYQHPHPLVQRKMDVMWLKSQWLPHYLITPLAGITENTLRAYLYEYLEGGIEALKRISFHRPTSELADYRSSICSGTSTSIRTWGKLYAHLYDLGCEGIEVDLSAHHLLYGRLEDNDLLN